MRQSVVAHAFVCALLLRSFAVATGDNASSELWSNFALNKTLTFP